MSSPSALLRRVLLALALSGATLLAACSGLQPVHGERGIGTERTAFRYASPAGRFDQIIYQELALKLGRSTRAEAPLLRVTTSTSRRDLTRTAVTRPSKQQELVLTALIEIVAADGAVVWSGTRSAAALYATDSQALAATEAEREAGERAARALAETVRLSVLGALAQPAG